MVYDIEFESQVEGGFSMKVSEPLKAVLPAIYTPTYFPGALFLRGPMVLIQADDHVLVVNFDLRTGVMFLSDEPPEEHAFFFDHDFKVSLLLVLRLRYGSRK